MAVLFVGYWQLVTGLWSLAAFWLLVEKGLRHRAQGIGKKPRIAVYEKLSDDSGWSQTGVTSFSCLSPWALCREPSSSIEYPVTSIEKPAASDDSPETSDQRPETRDQHPVSSIQHRVSRTQSPDFILSSQHNRRQAKKY